MVSDYIKVNTKLKSKFLVIAAEPLNEQVSQYGPFVMNTLEELENAISDFQLRRNGFENAENWSSKIKDLRNMAKSELYVISKINK